MTPQEFVAKWRPVSLTEKSASQSHFLDLCKLLGQQEPVAADPEGTWYTFERGVSKTGGGDGWADVWMRGHFGWEYKGKHKDLVAAYAQLQRYREALENPPLLVVCDMDRFEVHTNFTGTVKKVYAFDLAGVTEPENLDVLRKLFTEPEALRPQQTTVGVTEAASGIFGQLADALRARGIEAQRAAHFLMKLMFCFFAEDVELLPKDLFTALLKKGKDDPERLSRLLGGLFHAMSKGGDFGADTIAHFNGGLFVDADVIELRPEEIERLVEIARQDWAAVEPSIFGTLFERTLDPSKRAQIGAHYTSKDDILTLVEPVLMAPLRREWARVRSECDRLWPKAVEDTKREKKSRAGSTRKRALRLADPKSRRDHDAFLTDFVQRLTAVRILDPACGSGNFLYVAIQLLLDLEKEVIALAADRGLALLPHVRPTQLHGIEINPYAQQLAQVVIWIGYLQWMKQNGFLPPSDPVLEPIESIKLMDAVLGTRDANAPAQVAEPEWPEADVVIGNPPFLGGKLLRTNLGDEYVNALFRAWGGRVPREADLCCYWFEKARAMIEQGRLKRAGLLATQGIRGGANREVLKRIQETGGIFFAISDRDWILDGANVHVSMIGFDNGAESSRTLDGAAVANINPDLTSQSDLTSARPVPENSSIAFMGDTKGGAFDIPESLAREWIASPNPNGKSNTEVLRPWTNGLDVTRRSRGMWIIDFGCESTIEEASLYEKPFEYVRTHVKPERDNNNRESYRRKWWLHVEPRPAMREAFSTIKRFAATPNLTKFRLFAWMPTDVLPDHQLIVFARDDDYFFGVLHSAVHERWSLRMGTALEDRPRYTPTTCFETFPFPPLSGGIERDINVAAQEQRDVNAAAQEMRERIAAAAAKLSELRENWLNPKNADGSPALSDALLKKRTLTNLYNDRPTWLELAHLDLDRAVLAAYGWPEEWAEKLQPQRDAKGKVNPILGVADPATEQEMLARLLALNLEATHATAHS
jgi:type II restriction/modification system DNA methylase subunit YeeA